jgi:hypothetical protein
MTSADKNIHIYLKSDGDTHEVLSGSSPYEKYIILSNETLQQENRTLRAEIVELSNTNEELETDVDRQDKGKTYIKGLLKNFAETDKMRKEVQASTQKMLDERKDASLNHDKSMKNSVLLFDAFMVLVAVLYLYQENRAAERVLYIAYAKVSIMLAAVFTALELMLKSIPVHDFCVEQKAVDTLNSEIKIIMDAQDFIHEHLDSL